MAVSVYDYTDFRKFLNDHFEYRRQKVKRLTLQDICDEIGMKSAGHLSSILKGHTNLSKKVAPSVAKFCRLKKKEAEYFVYMVLFNQMTNHTRKKEAFEKLISYRLSSVYKVSAKSYKYYDCWYHSAIRSLTGVFDIRDNYTELATLVTPSIRAYQAKSSIELLVELNLIALDESGFYRPTTVYIDSGTHANSTAINSFVVSMLDRAKESLDIFPAEERKLSWVTMGIDQEGYEAFLSEMRTFRSKVADVLKKHRTADRVYQWNMQLFPLSKSRQALEQKEQANANGGGLDYHD
ncbi:MAG: TIGR02147 family protein, partial [Fibrobacteria bacterium]|nr:TIGR02147 family protein [Fibrobacteria bacterium]